METRSLSPTGAAHAGQSGQSETGPSAKGGKYHMTQGLVAQPPVKPVTQPSGNCWDVRHSNTRRLAIPVQRETPRGRVPKLAPAPWPRLKIKRQKCGGRRQPNKNVCEATTETVATRVSTVEKAVAPKRASNGRRWHFLRPRSSPPT